MGKNLFMRNMLCLLLTMTMTHTLKAQLTGTLTVPGTTYPDLSTLITALNTQGVGAGGVVINITAGNTQYAPPGGYQLGSSVLNGSLSASRTITINGNNNDILSPVGTGTSDGILVLKGVDYLRLNGLRLRDTNTVSGQTQMEWGIALVKLNGTAPFDGCQHITVSGCRIELKRTNTNSAGIYSGNHTASSMTALTITTPGDAHSNNTFSGNDIQNVFTGISLNGYNAPAGSYALYDQSNTVGGTAANLGNTIRNFTNPTNTVKQSYGIYLANQNNAVIQNNDLDNIAAGGSPNGAGTCFGICHATGAESSVEISDNKVALSQDSLTLTSAFTAIYTEVAGNTSSCIIARNRVTVTGGRATGQINMIQSKGPLHYLSISDNVFHNIRLNNLAAAYFINVENTMAANGSMAVKNNVVTGNFFFNGMGRSSAAFSAIWCISNTGASPAGAKDSIVDNDFSNILIDTPSAKLVNGISDLNGGSAAGDYPFKYIRGNTFGNYTGVVFNALNVSKAGKLNGQFSVVAENHIRKVDRMNTGIVIADAAGQTADVFGNRIDSVFNFSAAPALSGIDIAGGDTINVYGNNVRNMVVPDALSMNGIKIRGGNKISLYNNVISGLHAPEANNDTCIAGIYLSAGKVVNLFHNTVYLHPVNTVGLSFGVSGLYFTDSVSRLDLRNNIFYVDAIPAGDGIVSAVRRITGTVSAPPANLAATSGGNIYYAPPATSSYLYAEGSNAFTTINVYNLVNDPDFNKPCSAYKKFMAPADSLAFTEDNLQITGSGFYAPSGASYAKEMAIPTSGPVVTTDINNAARPPRADVGAVQFSGTPEDVLPPVIRFTPVPASVCPRPPVIEATITDLFMVDTSAGNKPRLYFKKEAEDDAFGNYPTDNTAAFNGWKYTEGYGTAPDFFFAPDYTKLTGPVTSGDSVVYFIAAQDTGAMNVSFNGAVPAAGYCPRGVDLTIAASPLMPGSVVYGYGISGTAAVLMPDHDTTVCSGYQLHTLSGAGSVYQWLQDGVTINRAGSDRYAVTTSARYRVVVSNGACNDTSGEISVTVNPLPDPRISVSGNVLSTTTFAGYQWNLNNQPVPGANGRTHTVLQDGDYSVTVTDANGCTNTSAIQPMPPTGIDMLPSETDVRIYPNPVHAEVFVDASAPVRLALYGMSGSLLLQSGLQLHGSIETADLPDGVYLLRILDEKGVVLKNERLLKYGR